MLDEMLYNNAEKIIIQIRPDVIESTSIQDLHEMIEHYNRIHKGRWFYLEYVDGIAYIIIDKLYDVINV